MLSGASAYRAYAREAQFFPETRSGSVMSRASASPAFVACCFLRRALSQAMQMPLAEARRPLPGGVPDEVLSVELAMAWMLSLMASPRPCR